MFINARFGIVVSALQDGFAFTNMLQTSRRFAVCGVCCISASARVLPFANSENNS